MGTALHRILAGSDGPGKTALPAGEFLHPVPLFAVVVLFANDHWLKGAHLLPPLVTGKLSDFAGLLFFPLLVTAALDTVLFAGHAPVDFSLRRWKLAAAVAATGALFCVIKLSPGGADTVAGALSALGVKSRIVADPWDLCALPSLAAAYWLGTKEIARIPLGRLEAIERARARGPLSVKAWLLDAQRCGAPANAVDRLAETVATYLDGGPGGSAKDVEDALAAVRNSV